MTTNIAELAERIRPHAATPWIVCSCPSPASGDDSAWLWVFREDTRSRLERLWGGTLNRPEADDLVDLLARRSSVWRGRVDSCHAPPSRRFRLAWTLPPAPCRIYKRRGLAMEVEPAVVTTYGSRRRRRIAVPLAGRVEGWIGRDWAHAGITLRHCGGEDTEVLRLENAGPLTAFLLMYDGIDLMVDTRWLDAVVPRVADVLGVGWRIVDYTVTPPKIERQGEPSPDPHAP